MPDVELWKVLHSCIQVTHKKCRTKIRRPARAVTDWEAENQVSYCTGGH